MLIVELAVSGVRHPTRWPLASRRDGIVYRPFHLPERGPLLGSIVARSNTRRLAGEVNRLCPPGDRIVCYDAPTQGRLVGTLSESRSIYLAIDDLTITLTGEPIAGELDAEKELLAKVDSVVCVSETLAGTLRRRLPVRSTTPIHVLENGYDERLFNPEKNWPEPSILQRVPRPRVLVMGHISERIDWDGVAACRRIMPSVHWVFVGPADRGMRERITSIGAFSFDKITCHEVAAWIAHSDFCAIPYRLNRFTQASSPIKAFEYLAMGAPTLSTRVDGLRKFGDALAWIDEADPASYASALDQLGREGRTTDHMNRRRSSVSGCSLAVRVEQFLSYVSASSDQSARCKPEAQAKNSRRNPFACASGLNSTDETPIATRVVA